MAMRKNRLIYLGLYILGSLSQFTGPAGNHTLNYFETGDRIQSHGIIDNEILYFGSNDKTFYAVDLKTGQEKWSCQTGSAVKSSATIKDSVIFFTSSNGIYALAKNTGE